MKQLLIIFVKNTKLGKVKTRLAKTIGDEGALEVYTQLVQITEKASETIAVDTIIYFSDTIINTKWKTVPKKVQTGNDLGERMQNAFRDGFKQGYESIVLIGSDLPEISKNIILNGFAALEKKETVFGPAEDGGYYLIGMKSLYPMLFENKPWSKNNLLAITLQELSRENIGFSLIETLNDIDTFEDLIKSEFYKKNKQLQEKFSHLIPKKL